MIALAIGMPAFVFGTFLYRGHRWALHGLRRTLALLLAGGAWITLPSGPT